MMGRDDKENEAFSLEVRGGREVDGMPGFRDSGMPPGVGGAGGGSEEMRL